MTDFPRVFSKLVYNTGGMEECPDDGLHALIRAMKVSIDNRYIIPEAFTHDGKAWLN